MTVPTLSSFGEGPAAQALRDLAQRPRLQAGRQEASSEAIASALARSSGRGASAMQTIFTRRQIETIARCDARGGRRDRRARQPRRGARSGPKFLTLEKVGRFNEPVHLAQPPGSDSLFVVEQPGRSR